MPTPATSRTPISQHDEVTALATLDAFAAVGDRVTEAMVAAVDAPVVVGNTNVAILIDLHREGPSRPSDLASRAGISRPQMTRLLDQMQAEQLLSRQRGIDDDGRAVTVTLTPNGRRMLETAAQLLHHGFTDLTATLQSLEQFLERTGDGTTSI